MRAARTVPTSPGSTTWGLYVIFVSICDYLLDDGDFGDSDSDDSGYELTWP
jgi:hypothetical protein